MCGGGGFGGGELDCIGPECFVIQVILDVSVHWQIVFFAYDGQVSFVYQYFSDSAFDLIDLFDFQHDGK